MGSKKQKKARRAAAATSQRGAKDKNDAGASLKPQSEKDWSEDSDHEDLTMPSRKREPTKPIMQEPTEMRRFWNNYDVADLEPRDQEAAQELVKGINALIGRLAQFRAWGRWADAELELAVTKLENMKDDLADAREALGKVHLERSSVVARANTLRTEVEEMISQAGNVTAEDRKSLVDTISGFADALERHELEMQKAQFAEEMEDARQGLAEQKAKFEEEMAVVRAAMLDDETQQCSRLAYHRAMCATAKDIDAKNPYASIVPCFSYGIHPVPNPEHPYWKGWEFGKWLQETGALVEEGNAWYGALVRPPNEASGELGDLSLQHPDGIIDSKSWFSGIRHGIEGAQLQVFCSGASWPRLPDEKIKLSNRRTYQ